MNIVAILFWNVSIMSGALKKKYGCPGHPDPGSQTFWGDLGSFPSGCERQRVEKDYCGGYKHKWFLAPARRGLTVYSVPLGTTDVLSWIILSWEGLSCAL